MNYLEELKLNPKNPRKITRQDLDKLKKSVSSFLKMLEIRPIAYDENKIIWGGNQRQTILIELFNEGVITEINPKWFKELVGFTEEEKHEFAIKDNRSFGTDDIDILMSDDWTIYPLEDWGINIQLPSYEAVDTNEMWQGMPEFGDKPAFNVYKSLTVHFDNEEDYKNFGEFIDQKLTDKTKFIWYPYKPREKVSEEFESE